jgi:hypothetical protein
MDERHIGSVEVRPEAQVAFNQRVQEEMRDTVWTAGGCASWYIDATGRNSTLWPGYTWQFRMEMRRFDPDEYIVRVGTPQGAEEVAA